MHILSQLRMDQNLFYHNWRGMNTHLQRFYHLFWVLAGHQGFDTEAGCSRWPFNRFLGWGDPDQTPGFAVCRWFSQENQRILMNLKGICYYFLVPVPDQDQPIQVVSSVCDIFQGNRSFAEHVMSFSEIFKRARVYGAGINHRLFAQMDSDAVLICGPAKLDGWFFDVDMWVSLKMEYIMVYNGI